LLTDLQPLAFSIQPFLWSSQPGRGETFQYQELTRLWWPSAKTAALIFGLRGNAALPGTGIRDHSPAVRAPIAAGAIFILTRDRHG
jgi:hypothetical protein